MTFGLRFTCFATSSSTRHERRLAGDSRDSAHVWCIHGREAESGVEHRRTPPSTEHRPSNETNAAQKKRDRQTNQDGRGDMARNAAFREDSGQTNGQQHQPEGVLVHAASKKRFQEFFHDGVMVGAEVNVFGRPQWLHCRSVRPFITVDESAQLRDRGPV